MNFESIGGRRYLLTWAAGLAATAPIAWAGMEFDSHDHTELPAAVDVSVTATLPKRISEITVERDAQRNITRSVTTERDA